MVRFLTTTNKKKEAEWPGLVKLRKIPMFLEAGEAYKANKLYSDLLQALKRQCMTARVLCSGDIILHCFHMVPSCRIWRKDCEQTVA